MNEPTERYEFVCVRCGADESVPFQPRNPDKLMCRECYAETGGKTYDLSRVARAPRRKHNTRVAFNITCAECGKQDELDYNDITNAMRGDSCMILGSSSAGRAA